MNYISNLTQQNYLIIFILLVLTIIIISCVFLFSILFFCMLSIGYILFKIQHFHKTGNFIQLNDYDEHTKKILLKYGNYKINNMYLMKDFLSQMLISMINYMTFFKCNELINIMYPFHSKLLLEISNENETKFVIIHKCPNIILTDEFHIKSTSNIDKIPICSNTFSIQEVLLSVKEKMDNKYFNWNLVDNNCQDFSKELICILKKKDDNTEYIKESAIKKYIREYNYTIYDIYILNIISSILIIFANSYLCDLLIIN